MLPPLATPADVTVRYPALADTPTDQLEALLNDASALARSHANRTWVDGGGLLSDVPDGVVGVVAAMVARSLINPTGVTQETTGPFNVSYGAAAADRLYLTRNEKLLLRGAQQAFTITPYDETVYAGSEWLQL